MLTDIRQYMLMCIFCLIITKTTSGVISYNLPELCPSATWNPDAITLANGSASLIELSGIFVNLDNTIYATDAMNNEVLLWLNDGVTPTSIISSGLSYPKSIFVDIIGDIYVDNGNTEGRVDKWSSNTNTNVSVMSVASSCYGLFIDINDTLYCSMHNNHRVIKQWLYSNANTSITVAGTGDDASNSDTLSYPCGIFVDFNFDLYVADYRNDRVQLFRSDELNGTTVAGGTSSATTIALTAPTGVVLDADGYLFIVEYGNNRIVGSGPLGFRCLVGCSGSSGAASNELNSPWSLSFDSHGNIFVADWKNNRIQKFLLSTNSCNDTITTTSVSTIIETQTTILSYSTETKTTTVLTTTETGTTTVLTTTRTETTTVLTTTETETTTVLTTTETQTTTVLTTTETETTTVSTTTKTQTTIFSYSTETEATAILTTGEVPKDKTTIAVTTTQVVGEQLTSIEKQFLTTTKPSVSNQTCQLPVITLLPETSSLEIRRSEDIYISSNIEFDCNKSFSIIRKWIISDSSLNELDISGVELTHNDLYIRPFTFSFDLYEFKLTAIIIPSLTRIESKSLFVQIIPSNITVNLIQSSTSLITHGQEQDLKLDPGSYSIDQDGYKFNPNDWNYKYSCRLYGLSVPLDLFNSSCLSNISGLKYDDTSKSSVTIFAGSLKSNITYQFFVELINRKNISLTFIGSLLVQIEEKSCPTIFIACSISMCHSESDYQLINPTSQIALTSSCFNNCSSIENIQWNVYKGLFNSLFNIIEWTPINQHQSLFFGLNTTNFTAMKQLFSQNSESNFWRFEVIYQFTKCKSSSSMIFRLNECPSPGSCSINGSSSLFTISCFNWSDEHRVKDYSIYFWTNDYSKQTLIGFSTNSVFQVRLPFLDEELKLLVKVRDEYDCQSDWNLSTIRIENHFDELNQLINSKNYLIFNQNQINQLIFSWSSQLNLKKNISSEEMNNYSHLREYFLNLTTNQIIPHPNSIQLQASTILQITNQLPPSALMIVADQCHRLALTLNSVSRKTSFEDLQSSVTYLAQCTANIHSAMDEQTEILDKISRTRLFLTSTINNHLNLGQNFRINTLEIFMSFEKIATFDGEYENEYFSFPLNLTHSNQTILIQSTMDRLAPFSPTNSSRSISISIFDENEKEISIKDHFIEMFIPRNPNVDIPPMILQNVTSLNQSTYSKLIHFQFNQISIHFQILPLNKNISYLFSYGFISSNDRTILFCPSNLTEDDLYTFYLNNEQTANHHSLIFTLKELNSTDCSKNLVFADNFRSDFYLRIYSSACYYLDQNNQWQSDGLIVGPKTNLDQTQCFSKHII